MKLTTAAKLNRVSKLLVPAFIKDTTYGYTKSYDFEMLRHKVKHPTEIELIKKAISLEKGLIQNAINYYGLNANLSNIMKTPEQFNYLSNAVIAGIKSAAHKDAKFGIIYRNLNITGNK